MKELFYYTIFAIILYFILNAIFDNINKEKENFTPSTTIPNSSIVTLATIAQNLLNGNGTFTNPGNLQIGTSTTAPGNLTVTGNTITSGIVSASGNINTGAIATGQLQIGSWSGRPAIWANTSNNPITLHNEGNTKAVQIGASTTYPNNLVVTGNTTSVSGLFGQRVEVSGVGNGYAFYDRTNSNNRFEWYSSGSAAKLYYNPADASKTPIGITGNLLDIDYNGNTNILGNLAVNKNLTVSGTFNANTFSTNSLSSNNIIVPGTSHLNIKPGTASPDSAIFTWGDGSGWRTRFGKAGSPSLDIYDNGTVQTNGMLYAPGNIDITNDNPYIIFRKKGGSRIPQIYSDGSILHVYNGTFQSDENANINGFLDVRGGANFAGEVNLAARFRMNGLPAMYYIDYTGANLSWNASLGAWTIQTGISGKYQASIGWCRITVRWEAYFTSLYYDANVGYWFFEVRNARDNNQARSEITNIRIYGYHNNLFAQ